MAKRDIFDSPLYKILNHVYWFALSNIYFMILNILLIVLLLAPLKTLDISFVIILFIVSIPFGPSLTALMSTMGKLVREGDLDVTKDFFKAFKQNFKQSLGVWIIQLSVLVILFIDIMYFKKTSNGVFIPVFYVIGCIVLIMGLYAFPIISRFYLKTIDVFRLSFYYAIKKFHITILNIMAIVGGTFILTKFSFLLFFFASLVCYLVMYYERNIMKELEEKISGGKENNQIQEENREMISSENNI